MVVCFRLSARFLEIPFFWFAGRLQKRFGTKALMLFAGTAAALRWLLLACLTNTYAILVVNMLSGCGFVGFSYSLIRYINDNVPKSMRATAQSLNGILGTFSPALFSPPSAASLPTTSAFPPSFWATAS